MKAYKTTIERAAEWNRKVRYKRALNRKFKRKKLK
jgi:hypothetical protein